jgi:hypothetical protein
MAKGVDVGVAVSMDLAGKIVEGKPWFTQGGRAVEYLGHVMRDRVRIVGTCDLIDGYGHGNGAPRPNQCGRITHAFGGDVVLCAAFVVAAPNTPVRDALEQGVELVRRHGLLQGFHAHAPNAPRSADR